MQDGASSQDWIAPDDGVKGLVSIVIPTCNRSAYLTETIESAFAQEHRPIQILVVDDASTDDTESVVSGLQDRAPAGIELLYFKQTKSGAPAARNRGVRNTTGEFIVFMDDDDVFSDNFLATHLKCFASQPSANLSFSRWQRFRKEESHYVLVDFKGTKPDGATTPLEAFFFGWEILLQSCLVRRSLVSEAGPWQLDLKKSQDLDYKVRLLGAPSCKVVDNSDATIFYRMHASSITGSLNAEKLKSYVDVFDYVEEVAQRRDDFESLHSTFARYLWRHAYWLTGHGKHSEAMQLIEKAKGYDKDVCKRNGPLLARVLGRFGLEGIASKVLYNLFQFKQQISKPPVVTMGKVSEIPSCKPLD